MLHSTFGIGDFGLWSAKATPVSIVASASRIPSGSLSMIAATMTPMIGTESVPMAAIAAGNRHNAECEITDAHRAKDHVNRPWALN